MHCESSPEFKVVTLTAHAFHRRMKRGPSMHLWRDGILEKPVSDRGTLGTYHNRRDLIDVRDRKLLILNGEMSEWSNEHAWKAKRASDIKALRRASTHTRPAT